MTTLFYFSFLFGMGINVDILLYLPTSSYRQMRLSILIV